jgi:bifunctional DNA-binding transcriptional regulator/antitoxin component of YhaV-PrlF toxin-antitoxin module
MIITKTRKWGNSIGVVLPKEDLDRLRIRENEEVLVEVRKRSSPLKELFGAGKANSIRPQDLKQMRLEWEGRH